MNNIWEVCYCWLVYGRELGVNGGDFSVGEILNSMTNEGRLLRIWEGPS